MPWGHRISMTYPVSSSSRRVYRGTCTEDGQQRGQGEGPQVQGSRRFPDIPKTNAPICQIIGMVNFSASDGCGAVCLFLHFFNFSASDGWGARFLFFTMPLAFCDGDTPKTLVLKMHLNLREPAIRECYRVLFLGIWCKMNRLAGFCPHPLKQSRQPW